MTTRQEAAAAHAAANADNVPEMEGALREVIADAEHLHGIDAALEHARGMWREANARWEATGRGADAWTVEAVTRIAYDLYPSPEEPPACPVCDAIGCNGARGHGCDRYERGTARQQWEAYEEDAREREVTNAQYPLA